MLQVKQSGINEYLELKRRSKTLIADACDNLNSSQEFSNLTLYTLQGTFLILSVGLVLASVAFLVEILYHKRKTRRFQTAVPCLTKWIRVIRIAKDHLDFFFVWK